jgi:hypothetical protein
MSTHLKSNKIKDDLEFEWLLCVARALTASQRQQPPEVAEAQRPARFPGTKNRKFIERALKKAFHRARKL